MTSTQEQREQLAQSVGAVTAALPGVVGVTLGGSVAAGFADEHSDTDVHVYWREPLASDDQRAAQLRPIADPDSLAVGFTTWGLEDHLAVEGQKIELVYISLDELERAIEQAYSTGLGGEGFVTAQFYYLANGKVLADTAGTLGRLRKRLRSGYPEPTRQALLADNPIRLHAYLEQLRTAQARGDLLYVQHRRYSLQMVFFNLLFALNRRYHPGEKRLLKHARKCPLRPAYMKGRWATIARLPANSRDLPNNIEALVEELLELVKAAE